jgi:flagellar biosynthetic protein FlhB
VALRYDGSRMRAPRVIARGADEVAAKIREIAVEHRVPLLSAPPLARALYYSTKLNDEIPAGLYVAVAQVLAYVFQLKQERRTDQPLELHDLPIPDDLRRET